VTSGARSPGGAVRSWPLEWVNGGCPPELVTAEVERCGSPSRRSSSAVRRRRAARQLDRGLRARAAALRAQRRRPGSREPRLREALFEHGLDIADPAVLRDVADRSVSCPPGRNGRRSWWRRLRGGSPGVSKGRRTSSWSGIGPLLPPLRIERRATASWSSVPGAIDSVLDEAVAAMAGPLPARCRGNPATRRRRIGPGAAVGEGPQARLQPATAPGPPAGCPAGGRRAERLGFDSVWTPRPTVPTP